MSRLQAAVWCLTLVSGCMSPTLHYSLNHEVSHAAPLPAVTLVVSARQGAAVEWDVQNDYATPELQTVNERTPPDRVIGRALSEEFENRGFAVRSTGATVIACEVTNLVHTRRIYGLGWYGSHNHFVALDMQCTLPNWSGPVRARWYKEGGGDGDGQDTHDTIGRAVQLAATQLIQHLDVKALAEDVERAQKLARVDSDGSKVRGLFKLALLGQSDALALQDSEPRVRAAAVLALGMAKDTQRLKALATTLPTEKHLVQWAVVAAAQMANVDITPNPAVLGPDAAFLAQLR